MKIECTPTEQILLKRSIKRSECNPGVCGFQKECDKPEDMTCGEYINSLIEWRVYETTKI